jgi:hypothetical protein
MTECPITKSCCEPATGMPLPGLARHTLTLRHGIHLIGTVYNFCTPHASLAHAGRGTTPAMAAGITDHC